MRKTMKILGLTIALLMVATTFVNTAVSEGGIACMHIDRNGDDQVDRIISFTKDGDFFCQIDDDDFNGWSDERIVDTTGDGVGDLRDVDTTGDHNYDSRYRLVNGDWILYGFISIPCMQMPMMPQSGEDPPEFQ